MGRRGRGGPCRTWEAAPSGPVIPPHARVQPHQPRPPARCPCCWRWWNGSWPAP